MGIVLSFFKSLFGWSDTNEKKAEELNKKKRMITKWLKHTAQKKAAKEANIEKEAKNAMEKKFPMTQENITKKFEKLNAIEKSKYDKNVQKIKQKLIM